MKLITTKDLGFAQLDVFEDFTIARISEGSIITPLQADTLYRTLRTIYNGEKFWYISHRINDYSIDPMLFSRLITYEDLLGIVTVCKTQRKVDSADFEKRFCQIPYEIFTSIQAAVNWIMEENKKSRPVSRIL